MKTEKPLIWKEETCLIGECKGLCSKHIWHTPMCTPDGLMTTCFNCGKTRGVRVENEIDKSDRNGTEWIKDRLAELS